MAAVAEQVRERVRRTPDGAFVHSRDLIAERRHRGAVDVALHRLLREGELVQVRRGLYCKGRKTRFGMARPDPYRVALEVARAAGFDRGVGPAGISAARALGLTTQVPAEVEVSVPGRKPQGLAQIRFTSRSPVARRDLRPLEVAVLELLREWPKYSEQGWPAFTAKVRELAEHGEVDVERVVAVARRERHVRAREHAERLRAELAEGIDPTVVRR